MAVDGESDAIAYQLGGARSPQVTNPSTADHTFGGGRPGLRQPWTSFTGARRSYAAIAEWVADVPAATALTLGIVPDRRPSGAMIRRLLQALDPDLLAAAIGAWLASRATATTPAGQRAIAVDGKTLRGSRTTDTPARHVMAACDQATGVVLASTDVECKTNEITGS